MKIISDFSDFYDYSPQMLGFQPDESLVYVRHACRQQPLFYVEGKNDAASFEYYNGARQVDVPKFIHHTRIKEDVIDRNWFEALSWDCADRMILECVVIGTKGYLIGKPIDGQHRRYRGRLSFLCKSITLDHTKAILFHTYNGKQHAFVSASDLTQENMEMLKTDITVDPFLIESVKSPVFTILPDRHGGVILASKPILREYGLDKILDPHQTYQDIEQALGIIQGNPDTAPPVEVDNESKIHAAGFDLKTSFRHPVSIKQIYGREKKKLTKDADESDIHE